MKIVVNVPEKYLNSNIIDVTLFTGANNTITDVNIENEYAEFQILPKGYGDLIDRSAVLGHQSCKFRGDCPASGSACDRCSDNCVEVSDIVRAKVIIPANKGNIDKEIMNDE